MRIAIPVWSGRVSPVFDVAGQLVLADVDAGTEVARQARALEETDPAGRTRRLVQLGTDVLICGAISRPLEAMLTAAGIQVVAQTCGPAEEVLEAFVSGQMDAPAFRMPGCRGRRRQFRRAGGAGRGRGGQGGGRAGQRRGDGSRAGR